MLSVSLTQKASPFQGKLIGSASSWNTPDTFNCVSKDGNYVIGIDGVDGEVDTQGVGAMMATVMTNTGEKLDTDDENCRCTFDAPVYSR